MLDTHNLYDNRRLRGMLAERRIIDCDNATATSVRDKTSAQVIAWLCLLRQLVAAPPSSPTLAANSRLSESVADREVAA